MPCRWHRLKIRQERGRAARRLAATAASRVRIGRQEEASRCPTWGPCEGNRLARILEQRIDPWLVAGRPAPPHPHPVPGNGSDAVKPTAAWAASLNTRASWRRWRGHRAVPALASRVWRIAVRGRQGLSAGRTAWTITRSRTARSPLSSTAAAAHWLGSKGIDASATGDAGIATAVRESELAGGVEADPGLVGQPGDPLGPQHHREAE